MVCLSHVAMVVTGQSVRRQSVDPSNRSEGVSLLAWQGTQKGSAELCKTLTPPSETGRYQVWGSEGREAASATATAIRSPSLFWGLSWLRRCWWRTNRGGAWTPAHNLPGRGSERRSHALAPLLNTGKPAALCPIRSIETRGSTGWPKRLCILASHDSGHTIRLTLQVKGLSAYAPP